MKESVSKHLLCLAMGMLLFGVSPAQNACDASSCIPAGAARRLACREHTGYESWERCIPTHVKAQYAGGMGFMSFGCGWDYGRKCRWETDILVGFLPKAWSDRTHATFTLKQNYIPWSIRCSDRFAVETLSCGIYLNLIAGEDYWVREPARYPGSRYYGFTSRLRAHLCVGQRFTWYTKRCALLRHISLFYEFSASDLDIIAKCGNKSLDLADIVYFSIGVKLQMLR